MLDDATHDLVDVPLGNLVQLLELVEHDVNAPTVLLEDPKWEVKSIYESLLGRSREVERERDWHRPAAGSEHGPELAPNPREPLPYPPPAPPPPRQPGTGPPPAVNMGLSWRRPPANHCPTGPLSCFV